MSMYEKQHSEWTNMVETDVGQRKADTNNNRVMHMGTSGIKTLTHYCLLFLSYLLLGLIIDNALLNGRDATFVAYDAAAYADCRSGSLQKVLFISSTC